MTNAPVKTRAASRPPFLHVDPFPIDPPIHLNFAGCRGSLQPYGGGQQWKPVYWRAGFSAPGRYQLESAAHLVSRPPGTLLVNPFGFTPFQPEDPLLAERFMVFVASPKVIPVLSTPGIVQALTDLIAVADDTPVDVYLSPNWLVVRKYCGDRHLRDQIRLVHRITALLGTLPWTRSCEPAIPAPSRATPTLELEGARCRVCGDSLFNPVAVCRGCATPHHMDCWRYAGGCATFACLGLAADLCSVPERIRAG